MVSNPETGTSPPDATQAQASMGTGGLRARILIVDDSYMVAEMLSNFLGKQGCMISYALDGAAAFDLVRQQPPDLIIADWVMPGLDGLELCRQLRESPDYAWIYYIIMTAREGNDNMERALEAGADEFLSKPFQAAELMTRVRAGLRIVEIRRQQLLKGAQLLKSGREEASIGSRQDLVAHLPQSISYSRSQVEPLSLFILRLANLTYLNRSLSADQKKTLLSQFNLRLISNLREGDGVFRYDEGQYIVVLSATTLPAAQLAAERCCQRMVQQAFLIDETAVEVQLQFGTASLEASDDHQGMALLRRAAQVMRENKQQAGAILSSPLTQATEAVTAEIDHQIRDRMRTMEAENLELRMRIGQLSKLETENYQLKQKIQQLSAQLRSKGSG